MGILEGGVHGVVGIAVINGAEVFGGFLDEKDLEESATGILD